MKRIITFFLLLFLIFPALAGAQNNAKEDRGNINSVSTDTEINNSKMGARSVSQESGDTGGPTSQNAVKTESQEQERTQAKLQNQGTVSGIQLREEIQLKARNMSELKEMIQNRKSEVNAEFKNLKSAAQRKVYQNQNRVRLAVHALLATEGLTGGIGKQISEIAKDFNNSVEATIKAEEKIQAKNKFKRFLFGGDKQAAVAIKEKVKTNLPRIEKLKDLYEQCNCSEEIKTVLQEQINNLEQEQIRLDNLAGKEILSNGILGWALKLFR